MIAMFRDPTVLQHDDPVRVSDGREAMRDGQNGAFLHQAIDGLGDLGLALRVECARGLIQDQDGCIAKECARDADSLALTAGEAHAAGVHAGLVPLRQGRDEVVRIRGTGGILDVRLAGICTEADV